MLFFEEVCSSTIKRLLARQVGAAGSKTNRQCLISFKDDVIPTAKNSSCLLAARQRKQHAGWKFFSLSVTDALLQFLL